MAGVSGDRQHARDADHHARTLPRAAVRTLGTGDVDRCAVHRYHDRFVRTFYIKRRAAGLPAVGLLVLVSVDDLLLEKPVLVIDAVAEPRHAHGRERFQEAGGKAAEAAVA